MVIPALIRRLPKMCEVDESRIFPNTSDPNVSEDDLKFAKASPKYFWSFKT